MNIKKKIFPLLLIGILILPLISAIPFLKDNCSEFIIIDNDKITDLPHNYRDISFLNISGSAQFTPSQIDSLKKAIDKPELTIIDLRQESHGFINDIAISFYSPDLTLNDGLTTEDVLKKELKQISKIKLNSETTLYDRFCKVLKNIIPNFTSTEEIKVKQENINYIRYAVKDGGVPAFNVVDNFVNFIKSKDPNMHLHFHCDAGDGRTTTFMIMYQLLNNDKNATLQEIQNFQTNLGTVKFRFDKNRQEFLQKFYDYIQANKSSNYETPYSEWVKK